MISNLKTSLLVPSQFPEFIRDNEDYATFVAFVQAYYEWLEQEDNVLNQSKNLLEYADIDTTTSDFLNYFINDFLPYFPEDALISKDKAIKVARQLYKSKGTPASYQFLFRILYNSDFEVYYTKDSVLKASDGDWYVTRSLKLSTSDVRFLNINNYRLFGETTKSIATVENSLFLGQKIEVFISNIERLFNSGEFVRVVDNNNQDVLFNGEVLRAKIVGQISQIKVDPNNRGLLYQTHDPVIVYNGLNPETIAPIGALAEVGTTTAGAIQRINVQEGGYGYSYLPNTILQISNAPGANAIVGSLDPNPAATAHISNLPIDTIGLKVNVPIGNTQYNFGGKYTGNVNTKLSDAFTTTSFFAYPISSVLVVNGGGGIQQIPQVTAESQYLNDTGTYVNLKSQGILAPIQIVNGGQGYQVNDTIVFTGGGGYGAYANVTNVAANGQILTISYQNHQNNYPLGGIGYRTGQLPNVTVHSANSQAANASIFVPGILGDGATFSVIVDRAGSITTINLIDGGEDYIATPNVSLKVQDIVVSNVTISTLPEQGDTVYQGATLNLATYIATVNSITLLAADVDPTKSLYNLRVFEYNSIPNPSLLLKNNNRPYIMYMANKQPTTSNSVFNSLYNTNGVRNYGDGTAKGTATFLNGLVIGQGQYLNTKGQLSSFNILQSSDYNNYTYQITVEKEIAKYREILLNLLHPAGMKVIGRYRLNSHSQVNLTAYDELVQAHTLQYYGNVNSYAVMTANTSYLSSNIITFYDMNGFDLTSTFDNTYSISMSTDGGGVFSQINSVTANTITLKDSVWLTYPYFSNSVINIVGSNISFTSANIQFYK